VSQTLPVLLFAQSAVCRHCTQECCVSAQTGVSGLLSQSVFVAHSTHLSSAASHTGVADETRAQSEFCTHTTQVALDVLQAGVAGVLEQSSLSRHWTHIFEKLSHRGSGALQSESAAQVVAPAQTLSLRHRMPLGHSELMVHSTQTPSGLQWGVPASAEHPRSEVHLLSDDSQAWVVMLQITPPSEEHWMSAVQATQVRVAVSQRMSGAMVQSLSALQPICMGT
jgi:hypothetical protein